MFLTTGAEAVENAVKISRQHTGRSGVIAFSGAFHGRTMLCLALTGKVIPYKAGFGPFPAEVFHVPFPIDYHGVTLEDSLAALDTLFKSDVEPSRIAAMIVEPVQGEGGFYAAPVVRCRMYERRSAITARSSWLARSRARSVPTSSWERAA